MRWLTLEDLFLKPQSAAAPITLSNYDLGRRSIGIARAGLCHSGNPLNEFREPDNATVDRARTEHWNHHTELAGRDPVAPVVSAWEFLTME